jgi:hypothetical protein
MAMYILRIALFRIYQVGDLEVEGEVGFEILRITCIDYGHVSARLALKALVEGVSKLTYVSLQWCLNWLAIPAPAVSGGHPGTRCLHCAGCKGWKLSGVESQSSGVSLESRSEGKCAE